MYESFVFYRSFANAVRLLPESERLKVYDALIDYALDDIEPELDNMSNLVFVMAKPQIDANKRRKAAGAKGGRLPSKTKTKTTDAKTSGLTYGFDKEKPMVKPMVKPNENVNENENEKDNEKDNEKEGARAKKAFGYYNNVRLTDEELQALMDNYPKDYSDMIERLSFYMKTKGKFYADHYATMTSWKREDEERAKEHLARSPAHGSAEELEQFYAMARAWADAGEE